MKRSVLGVLGCMIAAVAFAQDPVYSVNVVGFNKHQFEKGKLYLVATAFEDIDGKALKAADVIGSQLPVGTFVYNYDGVTPYKTDQRTVASWQSNITFNGFMGFWIKLPASGTQLVYDVVLKGQVPMDQVSSNVVASGLNMFGFPYTADVRFRDTALYSNSVVGDALYVFNPATTNYTGGSFSRTVAGWGAGTNLVLRQGMGFWYKSNQGSPDVYSEPRPYLNN